VAISGKMAWRNGEKRRSGVKLIVGVSARKRGGYRNGEENELVVTKIMAA
jgi:hypothetical protein